MKAIWLLTSILAASHTSLCIGQPSASAPIHCSVQKQQPATEADQAFSLGDFSNAEKLFAARIVNAATIESYAGLIETQLEQDKLAEALSSATKAQALFGQSAEVQSLLGDVYLRSGLIPKALTAFKHALEIDPCSGHAHFGLGRIARLNSAHASEVREFDLAHKLSPAKVDIAAAFFNTKPADLRLAGLQSLLANRSSTTPARFEEIQTQVEILRQHKSCIAAEAGSSTTQIELMPVLFNGRVARSWGLRTSLNGSYQPLLELDTSVSGIVLNQSDAQKAGVKPLLEPSATPTMASAPYTGYVDRVQVSNLTYRDCPVRVVPDASLAGSNSLIGADFFRDHLIHIDYVSSRLTLRQLPDRPGLKPFDVSDRTISPEQRDWSSVYVAGPAVLLPTFINNAGPYLFLMDTGIYRSVISPVVTASLLHPLHDATLNLQGISGSIVKVLPRDGGGDVNKTAVRDPAGRLLPVTTPLKTPVLHFTSNEYPENYSVSFDLSPTSRQAGVEVSGILGFGILHGYSLDIDYRDGLARILFDQNRTYDTRSVEGYH